MRCCRNITVGTHRLRHCRIGFARIETADQNADLGFGLWQRLDRDALKDLLRGTYRGERRSAVKRVEALENLEVTLASELFLLAYNRDPQ